MSPLQEFLFHIKSELLLKIKDTAFLRTLLVRCFWKLERPRNFLKRGRLMVHSTTIWNDVWGVWTAEKILKTRSRKGTFFRNLERCLGSLNCWENFENELDRLMVHSAAIWNYVLKLKLLRIFYKRGRLMVHSTAIWNDLYRTMLCMVCGSML